MATLLLLLLLPCLAWEPSVSARSSYPEPVFFCPASGARIPLRYQCDGLPDCTHGEDEAGCFDRATVPGGAAPSVVVPAGGSSPVANKAGYVKLPDELQQKQFMSGGFLQDYPGTV